MTKTSTIALLISLTFAIAVYGGVTGKIVGNVSDAENGQPLPGANVIVEGTYYGAATDFNGNYVIVNLPPGEYNLKINMLGYAEYRVEHVRVIINQTTTINAKLKSKVLVGDEVVVVAERPVVTKDVSNSQMTIEPRAIEAIPIGKVEEALTLQAGIQSSREGLIIRGGSANQVAFMVDGFSLNDERSNIPYMAVSMSSIQEVQVQTGGFNPEYGNARSGVVNVITKEGSRDHYSMSAIIRYRPATPKHFGPSVYDPNSYFNRPYLDPAVCWTGTNNGAWDEYTQRQYPYFEGWNAVSYSTIQDEDPTNDLTPEGAKRLYEWQHRRQGDIKKPDYVIDLGFGGPVPFINKNLLDLRFFATYLREQKMFVFPLSRDAYTNHYGELKLVSDITPSIKITLTGLYGEVHSVSPYSWKTTPTGYVLHTTSEVADLLNSSSGNSILYMPGYFSPASIFRNVIKFKMTHLLSPKTFYDLRIKGMTNINRTFKIRDRDLTPRYEPIPGYFVDEAPYGYYGYSETGIDGMSMGGWMNLGRDTTKNVTTSINFDLTSQVNVRNQIKVGFEFVSNDFNVRSGTESPSMSTWTRSMKYHTTPYRIGIYAQDKLEFKGFIGNIGLRLNYTNSNTEYYLLNRYDKYYSAGYGKMLEEKVATKKSKPIWRLAPYLGISHPITENSKLYFNYGHYYSEPSSMYRFGIQRESNGLVTNIGNPNLDLEKTIAYELGFEQNIYDMFLLSIAGYYKDVTDQIGWVYYENINNSVQYYKSENNNYQDIRGFEFTLTKRMGTWITGFINYTYQVQTSGYFGLLKYYEDPNKQRDYRMQNPYQERPRPRPYARAIISFHTPAEYGPRLSNLIYPLGDWNLNVLAEWKAGAYYTYNPYNIPGVVDDTQWRDWYNIDLRISKNFGFKHVNVQFYMDITNAFNIKYMSYAGFADRYDWLDYLESLNFPWEEGEEKGNDRIGDYRPVGVAYDPLEPNPDNDPEIKKRNDRRKKNKSYIDMPNIKSLTFLNPRDIILGIKINF